MVTRVRLVELDFFNKNCVWINVSPGRGAKVDRVSPYIEALGR